MSHPAPSRASRVTGRVLSVLVVALFALDAILKLLAPRFVVDGTAEVGFPAWSIVPLGVILLACTICYAVPRTAVLGAILLTGYLGGAVATHLRIAHPLFSHTLVPVYFGIVLWLALWLRRPGLRAAVLAAR